MFSLLSKAVSFLTGDQEDDELQPQAPRQSPWLPNDGEEKSKEQTRLFTGKVTAIHSNYGLVDGDVYFSFDALMGAPIPKVATTVEVTAKRKSEASSWCAVSVTPLVSQTEWKEDGDVAAVGEEGWEPSQPHDLGAESTGPHSLVAMITEMREDHGYLNGTVFFESTACEGVYQARRGDWVSAEVDANSRGAQEAKIVQPIRKREFKGQVTKVALHQSVGFIDDEIVFHLSIWKEATPVRRGDTVQGLAVECSGRTTWRAYSLQPAHSKDTPVPGLEDRIAQSMSPSRPQYAELFQDREGIQITGSLDLGDIQLQRCKVIGLQIRNVGPDEHTFNGCVFPSSHQSTTTFKLTCMSYGSVRPYVQTELPVDEPVVLPPSCNHFLIMSVSCQPGVLGKMRQMLLFEFAGFKIARWTTFNGLDPKQWELTDGPAYRGNRNQGNRPQRSGDTWVVPGQRPMRSMQAIQLPNRLPQYPIPESLRLCVDRGEDLFKVAPTLAEDLSLENYSGRFQALLHLEELQQNDEIGEFDMDGVSLRNVREFLALDVPGLSEGRPSLMVGDRVILSKNSRLGSGPGYEGFVHEVHCDEVLLKFQDDFQQKYTGELYNVSFQINRTSFRRMHQAAEFAPKLGATVLFPTCLIPKAPQTGPKQSAEPAVVQAKAVGMRRCPLNAKSKVMSPSSRPPGGEPLKLINPMLNARQRSAVQRILNGQSRPTPYILFGPPGTGKTVTVVEAILQTFSQLPSSRVIVCAPSNSAADLLTERLHASGLVKPVDMVRLNAFHRELENIPPSIHAYCDNGDNLELVARHRILVCTCSTAGMMYALGLKQGHFTHAFIDEAGQATEPECMIAAGLVAGSDGQVVLAGDPMQLGAVLRCHDAKHFGLSQSFLERLINRDIYKRDEQRFADHGSYDPFLVTKLVQNYRSHAVLLKLPSDLFYHGELEPSAPRELVDVFCEWQALPNQNDCPLIFHGLRGEDLREGSSPSWFNAVEALQVMKYLQLLTNNDVHQLSFDDIGIITPYRKQVEKIRLLIDKLGMEKVKVGSVEEFQGQERPAIIISMVRSQESEVGVDVRHNLGFLSNPKRFNVAITRAQSLLVVIGNPHVLIKDQFWCDYISYCVRHGAYTGCDLPDGMAQLLPMVQGHGGLGDHCSSGDSIDNKEGETETLKVNTSELSDSGPQQTPEHEDLISMDKKSAGHCDIVPQVDDTQMCNVSIPTPENEVITEVGIEPHEDSFPETEQLKGVVSNVDQDRDSHRDLCDGSEGLSSYSDDTSSVEQVSVIDASDYEKVHEDLSPMSCEVNPITETQNTDSFLDVEANESLSDATFRENTVNQNIEDIYEPLTNTSCLLSSVPCDQLPQDSNAEDLINEKKSAVCDFKTCDDVSNGDLGNDKPCSAPDGHDAGSLALNAVSTKDFQSCLDTNPSNSVSALAEDLVSNDKLEDAKEEESCTDSSITKLAVVQPRPKVDDTDEHVHVTGTYKENVSLNYANRLDKKPDLPVMKQTHVIDVQDDDSHQPLINEVSLNNLKYDTCDSLENTVRRIPVANLSLNKEHLSDDQKPCGVAVHDRSQSSHGTTPRRVEEVRKDHPPTSGPPKPTPTDLAIMRQLHYYFNDFNLSRDAFMIDLIKKHDGWVPLDVLITFKRLKSLAGTSEHLIDVLKNVHSNYIQLSEDCSMVGRIYPLPNYNNDWMTLLRNRAVHVDRVPMQPGIEALEDFFAVFGTVEHIQFLPGFNRVRRDRGDIMVVFSDAEGARKLLLQHQVFFRGSRMRPSVRNDVYRLLYPNKRQTFIHGQSGANPPAGANGVRSPQAEDLNRGQQYRGPSRALPPSHTQWRREDRRAMEQGGSRPDRRERWDARPGATCEDVGEGDAEKHGAHAEAKPQRLYERRMRPGLQNPSPAVKSETSCPNQNVSGSVQYHRSSSNDNYEVGAAGRDSCGHRSSGLQIKEAPAEPFHIQSWSPEGDRVVASWGVQEPPPSPAGNGLDNKSQPKESIEEAKPQRQFSRRDRPRFANVGNEQRVDNSGESTMYSNRLKTEDPSQADIKTISNVENRWHNTSNIPPRFRHKQNRPDPGYEKKMSDSALMDQRSRSDSTTSRSSNSGDDKPPTLAGSVPRGQSMRGRSSRRSKAEPQAERTPHVSSALATFMGIRSTFTPTLASSDTNEEDSDSNRLSPSYPLHEKREDGQQCGLSSSQTQSNPSQYNTRLDSRDAATSNSHPGWDYKSSVSTDNCLYPNGGRRATEASTSNPSVSDVQDWSQNSGLSSRHNDNDMRQNPRSEPGSRTSEAASEPQGRVTSQESTPVEYDYDEEEDLRQYSNLEQADDDVIIESSDEEILED